MVISQVDAVGSMNPHSLLVDRARSLAPKIRERTTQTESLRSVPRESMQEIIDAGLGARLLTPQRFGGDELFIDVMYEVSRELGRACASTAWCAALLPHNAHMVGFFPDEAQDAVWANGPDACLAASLAPAATVDKAPGGYRITGRHGFASGVDHASWVIVSGLVEHEGRRSNHHFLVRPGDYSIEDDWFAAGMRGTGSKTIVVNDVFVPEAYVLPAAALIEGHGPDSTNSGALYRLPIALHAGLTFLGPMMGTALDAFDYFVNWTRGRAQSAGSESVQEAVATSATDLELAQLLIKVTLNMSRSDDVRDLAIRAEILRNYNRAAELVTDSVERLFLHSGTSGFKDSNPMQQKWRDVRMMASHVSFTRANMQHYARLLLGLDRDPKLVIY